MTKITTLLFLALLGTQAGCATTGKYEAKLQSWINNNADDLIREWGPPTNSATLANGEKIYQYNSDQGAYFDYFGRMIPNNCRTDFTISPANIVTDYKFIGRSCRSR